jgi:CRP-like cAMP-binding protein
MQHLFSQIIQFYPLPVAAQNALLDCLEKKVMVKNEFLLTEGKICRHLYFLETGAVRGFYNLNGKDMTHWFVFENDFVTSFHSIITGKPAVENIQLLEGCVLWAISKNNITALFDQHHEIERLVRIACEKYYIRLRERYVNVQFKTAKELYKNLLAQSPHILERIPLGCIVSYLGISQETLSRIRS